MSFAAEQAYFDGIPVQHIAEWEYHQRRRHLEEQGARLVREINRYERRARFAEARLFADVREVIERADRAIKGDIQ